MTQPLSTVLDKLEQTLREGTHPVRRGASDDFIMIDFDPSGRESAMVEVGTGIETTGDLIVTINGYDRTGGVDYEVYAFTTERADFVLPLLDGLLSWQAAQEAAHEAEIEASVAHQETVL
jgi:hypothetical protein